MDFRSVAAAFLVITTALASVSESKPWCSNRVRKCNTSAVSKLATCLLTAHEWASYILHELAALMLHESMPMQVDELAAWTLH